MCYGFVKLAVLQFYKRIFSIRGFILAANVAIAFVVLFMIAATIVCLVLLIHPCPLVLVGQSCSHHIPQTQIFSAWPISNWWKPGGTYSISYGVFLFSFAAIDMLLDIVILCLPLPVIRKLHMEKSKKFMLVGVFWMGFL